MSVPFRLLISFSVAEQTSLHCFLIPAIIGKKGMPEVVKAKSAAKAIFLE